MSLGVKEKSFTALLESEGEERAIVNLVIYELCSGSGGWKREGVQWVLRPSPTLCTIFCTILVLCTKMVQYLLQPSAPILTPKIIFYLYSSLFLILYYLFYFNFIYIFHLKNSYNFIYSL
ncbi:hypothetical protein MANES_07G073352v8 [Manihot esculenta]|uniref:Uncharacterized protein n=1 Tax=Manihot esculenta TaxID=3983 RepID=A0ACB7HDW0_MANES|nr:hypothetical protein MANES_07G073352v8 [Manihot esculenta]